MSSSLYRTTGIVLSRRDHFEADRWYSVLTPENGKVEFLARGGSKPLAKLTPHLETIAVVDLLIVRGHVYQIVAGVERLHAFSHVYDDFSKLILANNAMHLINIGTRENDSGQHLFDLLKNWLMFLNSDYRLTEDRAGFALGSFALKLLALTGYRPELERCLVCGGAIEEGKYAWHSLKGGVVCNVCKQIDQEQWFASRPMKDGVLKLLRFGLCERFEDQLRPYLASDELQGFHEAVESLIVSHFPIIPASSLREACAI